MRYYQQIPGAAPGLEWRWSMVGRALVDIRVQGASCTLGTTQHIDLSRFDGWLKVSLRLNLREIDALNSIGPVGVIYSDRAWKFLSIRKTVKEQITRDYGQLCKNVELYAFTHEQIKTLGGIVGREWALLEK